MCVCVCVCIYIFIYIYIYMHLKKVTKIEDLLLQKRFGTIFF